LKQNKVEIVFLPVPASDTTITRKYDTYIYVNDEAETLKYERYTRSFEQIQGNLPYKVKSDISFTNRPPSIKIARLVFSSNPNAASIVYPGPEMISLYNYPIRAYKIVIFKNRTDAYVDSVLKLIGTRIIGEAAAIPASADVDSESYLSNLVMHRISHHFGRVFLIMPKKDKPSAADEKDDADDNTTVAKGVPEEKEIKLFSDLVKDNFPLIEDIKTDVVSIYNVSYLKKEGSILPGDEIVMYNTYLASLLDRLRRNPNDPSGKSALIQFNYLLKEGAVVFNITTKKLSVQAAVFVDAVEEFAKVALEQSQFFYGIIRENYKAGPELDAYMDCLKDIPVKMSFQLAATGN
jgi:hypothetical protein